MHTCALLQLHCMRTQAWMHTCALLQLHCMRPLTAISAGAKRRLTSHFSRQHVCCCCVVLQLGIPFPCNAVGSQCVLRVLYLALYPCCACCALVRKQGALQSLQQVQACASAQCMYICLWRRLCACAACVDQWWRTGISRWIDMLAGCCQPCSKRGCRLFLSPVLALGWLLTCKLTACRHAGGTGFVQAVCRLLCTGRTHYIGTSGAVCMR
jgi:hypothetical protein